MNNRPKRRKSRRQIRRQKQIMAIAALIVMIILVIAVFTGLILLIKKVSSNEKKPSGNTTQNTESNKSTESEHNTDNTSEPSSEDTTTSAKIDKSVWFLQLVNASHTLSATPDIELETLKNGYQCDKRIADDLQDMFDDARAAGLNPIICSAFRTHERQIYLYNLEVENFKKQGYSDEEAKRLAGTSTAVPGTSEHELGLALDIVSASYQLLNDEQANTPEQQWLMANCYKYGFILRYPKDKEHITGIMYEPWHYRYVGKEAAKEITEKGLCLEEYLEMY